MGGHPAGQVGQTDDFHSPRHGNLIHYRTLDVAAALHSQVHHHATRPHPAQGRRSDQPGGFAAKNLCGGDHDIRLSTDSGKRLLLPAQLLPGERLRVAMLRLSRVAQIDLHKTGSQRFDLLFHRRPCIVGLDPRPQPLGRGYGLEAGHSRPQHENPRRKDGAGRSRHHGKDLVQGLGCQDHRHIPGQAGLRTQGIHFLSQGGPGNQLHADGADPSASQQFNQPGSLEWIQETDGKTTLWKACHILRRKAPNPDNQVGSRQHFLSLG